MKRVKQGKKVRKFITEIIQTTLTKDVSAFFKEIEEFQEITRKISDEEHAAYEQYFNKHMTHQINLVQIELRKIEMKYRESVHRTSKQIEKFSGLLADPNLKQHMRVFYQEEFMKILAPMYHLEQLKENFSQYLDVLEKTQEEFSEWFFLARSDYLKQILQPYIVEQKTRSKTREIWIYQKHAQELTESRKKKIYETAGVSPKK